MSAGLTASDSMFLFALLRGTVFGAVLDGPPASVAEAIEAAGLGWSVVKKPLAVDLGPNLPDVLRYKRLSGHYVTVRQDSDEELGSSASAIASCGTMKRSHSSISSLGARDPLRDRREPAWRSTRVGARDAPRAC